MCGSGDASSAGLKDFCKQYVCLFLPWGGIIIMLVISATKDIGEANGTLCEEKGYHWPQRLFTGGFPEKKFEVCIGRSWLTTGRWLSYFCGVVESYFEQGRGEASARIGTQ